MLSDPSSNNGSYQRNGLRASIVLRGMSSLISPSMCDGMLAALYDIVIIIDRYNKYTCVCEHGAERLNKEPNELTNR